MAPDNPHTDRTTIRKIVREEIADYLDSEQGKGHLVCLLNELENDEGQWYIVTSEREDKPEPEDTSKLVSLIRSARAKLTREEYIAVLHLGREGAKENGDD
ncbi:MAG: hypothetical protein A4E36_00101 [Methanoregulaceae archaeon PtaB.Bin009]|jgi:hypothetical protein|nr:MAG: hypothetical protein A4E36_00101 [Methanoregulaceae archaeon PtaB.Bin009]OPY42363.1 MAG: hypothetical protein A4E41_00355 [Methanoregulaceae archaeon PtaU1.Bin066]